MNKLGEWLLIGVIVVLKLVVTGICLAIGFALGNILMTKAKTKLDKRKQSRVNKEEPIPAAV